LTVTVRVLPDGSVSITDGRTTFPPLSPAAVQAVAAQAETSANAANTRQMAETLAGLATLITAAAPAAGGAAYAQVTVTPGQARAVLDETSFDLVKAALDGSPDGSGGWVVGPLTVTPQTTQGAS